MEKKKQATDTCYEELDIDGDVIMKDDDEPSVPLGKVGLNIINNLFCPVLCGIGVHKEKREKLFNLASYLLFM